MKKNKSNVIRLTDQEKQIIEQIRFTQNTTLQNCEPEIIYETKTYNEGKLYFILPDAHYPYQNQILMDKVFRCIEDNKPKGVCISGDWLDLHVLGSYSENSLKALKDISLSDEYKAGLKGIEDLEAVLPKDAERMFLFGNHEDRYFRQLQKKDNAKYGDELQNPIDALKLKEYGYEVKTNWKDDFFTIGDIDIMHGIYCNIYTAKKHLDMNKRSVMFGHSHRAQSHFTGDSESHNIGCLCDIENKAFHYMPRLQREQWVNSFSAINVINGKSHVENIIVKNGSFMFRGKQY